MKENLSIISPSFPALLRRKCLTAVNKSDEVQQGSLRPKTVCSTTGISTVMKGFVPGLSVVRL